MFSKASGWLGWSPTSVLNWFSKPSTCALYLGDGHRVSSTTLIRGYNTQPAFGKRCSSGVSGRHGVCGPYDNLCESFFASLECEPWTAGPSRPMLRLAWPSSSTSRAGTTHRRLVPLLSGGILLAFSMSNHSLSTKSGLHMATHIKCRGL